MIDYPPALMTDMYKYIILDAALKGGTADCKCVFGVFMRHLSEGCRYDVAAGIGRVLDALRRFHSDEADLKFLANRYMVNPETIKWLENLHFSGTVHSYREDEMFFPNSPILQIEGTFGECTLLETLVLSVLNYDSAVASVASCMASVVKNRPCMDMGGRRTNEWATVAAARAVVMGEFKGTADLLAAWLYGLKATGTTTHCFTLVHDSECDAFEPQIEALGKSTTLLMDTYNIEKAVKTAVEVADPELGGVRIDSGDLAAVAQRVCNQLDALGAANTTTTMTDDLDEYTLAALQAAPIDSYGVGIMLVIGPGAPTRAMVHKLTECEGTDGTMVLITKKSKGKATVPGRKLVSRFYEYTLAEAEHVIFGSEEELVGFTPEPTWKNLLVDFADYGHIDARWQDRDAIMTTHGCHAKALSELPITAQGLMKDEPVAPTETQAL